MRVTCVCVDRNRHQAVARVLRAAGGERSHQRHLHAHPLLQPQRPLHGRDHLLHPDPPQPLEGTTHPQLLFFRLLRCLDSVSHLQKPFLLLFLRLPPSLLLGFPSQYHKTIEAVYSVENSVDTLLDLLQRYREKAGDKVAEKGGSIFTKACFLLALLLLDKRRTVVRSHDVTI